MNIHPSMTQSAIFSWCLDDRVVATLQDFFLKYLASTWAVVLIIGPFFGGHLRPEDSVRGRAAMLSDMRYHTSVIISLFRCCASGKSHTCCNV